MTTNLYQTLRSVAASCHEALVSDKFWAGVALGALLVFVGLGIARRRRYTVAKVGLKLPFGLGSIEYAPTDLDRTVAWKLYVQLKTRKAAIIFDEKTDVISEVYDSLYEVFPITRNLLSDVPMHEAGKRDGVVELIIRVLNDGLRPHLTKWSASYRRWWDQAKDKTKNSGKSPQEVQRQYPEYKALVEELKAMNTELSKYAEDLLAIVRTPARGQRKLKPKLSAPPEQPHPQADSNVPAAAAAPTQETPAIPPCPTPTPQTMTPSQHIKPDDSDTTATRPKSAPLTTTVPGASSTFPETNPKTITA